MNQQELLDLKGKIAELTKRVEQERYEDSLTSFVRGAWSTIDSSEYKKSWAVDALCDHLEGVTLGHIPRLLINISPRTGKTNITSISWPAWTWARSNISYWSGPQVRFLCGSYNHDLALQNSNKNRRLIQSPWYQQRWGEKVELRWDQNSKQQFDTTAGGSRIATSVGGTLLGIGGDILVIDDPHNTEAVETESDRERVKNWWKELHSTRLNDPKKSSIVVVMQRLHEGDLSGVILDSDERWTHLMLPMRYDDTRHCVTVRLPQYDNPDPWEDPRTFEGELMWPERFGEREVEKLEEALGPYMSSGRLQQCPTPKGGGILKREYWRLWDHEEAERYGLVWNAERKEFPHMELILASLDTSYGEKQENDFNALTVWGVWIDRAKNRRLMLMFAWNKRLPLHGIPVEYIQGEAKVNFEQRKQQSWGLIEWVANTCKKYKVQRLLIENKTRGRDVAQEINRLYARENWGVELIDPTGDKVSRAWSVEPLFADGTIWAPDTRWAEMVLTQCQSFPKSDHDDLVDTASMAISWLRESGLIMRGDEMSAAMEDDMMNFRRQESVAESYGVLH